MKAQDLKKKLWILLLILLTSCKSAPDFPDVEYCIIDARRGVAYCQTVHTKKKRTLDLRHMDSYISTSNDDFLEVRRWQEEILDECYNK